MLQFCRISTSAVPRWAAAARSTSVRPWLVGVDRARDEARLRTDRDRQRVERLVDRPERRRLRHLAALGGRRVLALRQPVDLVVEEQDREVDVAAQRVDQVVAADRERVAVAGRDPHGQVGAHRREPCRDRGRPPVDGVHPVGLHVVREACGAPDAGDEDDVLTWDAELRHEGLQRGQDRVVAAAGAPAHLLVGLEVLRRQLDQLPVPAPVADTHICPAEPGSAPADPGSRQPLKRPLSRPAAAMLAKRLTSATPAPQRSGVDTGLMRPPSPRSPRTAPPT